VGRLITGPPTAASTCASVAYNANLRIGHVGTLPGDYMVSLGRLRLLGHRFRAFVPIPPPPTVHRSFRTLQDLVQFAQSLNNRPRKTLGYMKPSEKLAELLALTG